MAKKQHSKTHVPEIEWSELLAGHPNYDTQFRRVSDWVREECSAKELKEETITWFKQNDESKVEALNAIDDWRFRAVGIYYYMLNNGAELRPSSVSWLDEKIEELIQLGQETLDEKAKLEENKVSVRTLTDEDIGRSLASDLEDLILEDRFDGDSNAVIELLNKIKPSPTAIRHMVNRLTEFVDEMNSFTDDEISEGFINRKAFETTKAQYTELLRIGSTYKNNAKTLRKVRKSKKNPTSAKVQRTIQGVNIMEAYPELNLVSVPADKIVGARGALVYNTKNRKVGLYKAKDEKGLIITGTTIKNFDENKSGQKTLRKPEVQIESLRSTTLKRAEIVLRDNINAKMASITGRLNDKVIVINAWK